MKRLFLTSQVKSVVHDISKTIGDTGRMPGVYITTSFMYKSQQIQEWQVQSRASLVKAGFSIVDYDIAGKSSENIAQDLVQYEIMYVEGGNTAYLLQQAQQNNFGEYVKKRVGEGMIYIASSAGSVIVGPDISPADRPGKTAEDYGLTSTTGFNLVDFVVMPHWGDPTKKEDYMQYKIPNIYNKTSYPYILLADNQYVEVKDDWYQIVNVTQ